MRVICHNVPQISWCDMIYVLEYFLTKSNLHLKMFEILILKVGSCFYLSVDLTENSIRLDHYRELLAVYPTKVLITTSPHPYFGWGGLIEVWRAFQYPFETINMNKFKRRTMKREVTVEVVFCWLYSSNLSEVGLPLSLPQNQLVEIWRTYQVSQQCGNITRIVVRLSELPSLDNDSENWSEVSVRVGKSCLSNRKALCDILDGKLQ